MSNFLMANLDGNSERMAFDIPGIKQIIGRHRINIVTCADQAGSWLEMGGEIYPIQEPFDKDRIKPYFIVLHSGMVLNISDYQILFNAKELPNHLLTGQNADGCPYLCVRHRPAEAIRRESEEGVLTELDRKNSAGAIPAEEFKNLKEMIRKLKQGEFFEALTMEFTGKIKEIARELIEFRKDIQKRIEPDIVEIAAKDIPEASYQLEGINETLEKSTMKIMDINEEQMELSKNQYEQLRMLISDNGQGAGADIFWSEGRDLALKIRALLGAMPQEAKEAADFILPNLNLAIEHMSQKGDAEQIIEALEEPIGIIKDLVRDCGNSHAQFARLEELNSGLVQMVKEIQKRDKTATAPHLAPAESLEALRRQMQVLKKIGDLSLRMMEPLSFQDLVGQRIQRIIKLIKTMELRIEDLVISFGIKFRRHREDPGKSYEDLKKEVEKYRSELKGPQREGQGLSQGDIDELLATL